jgi:hypothetical protein
MVTRSVTGCIPTQSVGMHPVYAKALKKQVGR